MNARVTQRDIARAAGVSHVTVSLALRESPSIPEETRQRIRKIADRLGYSPDPMLAALASYRKQQRPAAHQANIAWLASHPDFGSAGAASGDFGEYYQAARARASELGYVLDEIKLWEEQGTPRRIRRLLDARNITGLILAPAVGTGVEFKFDLTRYSAVRIGHSYRSPLLHTVANAQFRTTLSAMQKVVEMGYERIGTILTKEIDERTSFHFLGGYFAGLHHLPQKKWIGPFYASAGTNWEEDFFAWLKENRIECFVAASFRDTYHKMIKRGITNVAYVDTQVGSRDTFFTGIHQNSHQIGIASVDLLVSLMHRHELGVPKVPLHLLIEGSWREGKTAAPKKRPAA